MKRAFLILSLTALLGITGCSNSSPKVSITLSQTSPQNAIGGQVIMVAATLAHDAKAAGVTWSLTGGGALSGQTTSAVTYTAPATIAAAGTATLTATSITDPTRTTTLTINLVPISITLTPSTAQTLEQTQTLNVTAAVAGDSATKGVTWSLNSGAAGTLSNQTATSVTYNAPATVTTASSPVLTATSVSDNTKTSTLTLNLVPPPSVTTASLPNGTVNAAYSSTLAVSNGAAPYTWSVTVGTLPAGVILNSATGVISGTPTAYGTSSITVQVKDKGNFTATAALSIKILPAPVAITTTSLPNGVVNTAGYSTTLASTGGATPISWSWTAQAGSTLPPGLILAPTTGVISGTPTAAGTFNVSVTATDSSTPALTATKNLSVTIIPQLAITTSSPLPSGITSTAYSATLASTGGVTPIAWTLATGSGPLPGGLTLSSAGAITGTPTAAGTFNFTVQAADSGAPQQKVTKAFAITIIQKLAITTPAALPTGSVTTPYSLTLTSGGGTGAVTWALATGSTLPGGLTLTAAGLLSGTPTTANTYNFSITATDSGTPPQTATVAFTLTVTPKLAITTASLPSGTLGTAYTTTVQSNNGGIAPITWSWIAQAGSSLAPGLNITPGTGVISGTPTATGAFNVTVTAADSSSPAKQTASANLTISIATAPLSVATTGLPNGVVGQGYTGATLQSAGGNPPVTWSISVGALPTWATLNASTGAITGTPTATGTTTFTVKATDSTVPTAQTATKSLSITVASALSITTTSLPNGTVGNSYTAPVAATGGTTPYTWSWIAQTGSSLPPGLSINSSTGAISGTAGGSGGTYNVTVTVADSSTPQQTTSANFSITLTVATLMVTSTSGSLPAGTINTAYPNTNLNATGGVQPYTWALVLPGTGPLPPGLSLSAGGQITGTPTTNGTYPFTVQVTDSTTATAQANLSITVAATTSCATLTGKESLLQGDYAFTLNGFDSSSNPVFLGGVFTASGAKGPGNITAGTLDMNLVSGVQTGLSITSASSYHLGLDPNATNGYRGCMSIVTSAGTTNYRFSVDAVGAVTTNVASDGHIIGFDAGGPFISGILRQATPSAFSTSAIAGNWAFGAAGAKPVATGGSSGYFAVVGVLTLASGSISGVADANSNGKLDNNSLLTAFPATAGITLSSGPYSIASNGRGTASFTPTGSSSPVTNIFYVVSSSEFLILNTDAQVSSGGTNSAFTGRALKQSGTFSNSSLSGSQVVYVSGGSTNGSTAASRTEADIVKVTSGNNFTFSGYQNDGGNISDPTKNSGSGTFSVASNGRVTLTVAGATNLPVFYLSSANTAFFLNSDSAASAGNMEPQVGSSFTNSSASGTYGFGAINPAVPGANNEEGTVTFTPSPASINGTSDKNNSGTLSPDNATGSISYAINSTGVGLLPAGCTLTGVSANCENLFIVISPTKAVLLKVKSSNTTPVLDILQQ